MLVSIRLCFLLLILFIFNALLAVFGGTIYSYSPDSFLFLFFPFISLAFLPEMTGKTYQEIEKFLLEQELNRIGNIKEDDL